MHKAERNDLLTVKGDLLTHLGREISGLSFLFLLNTKKH